MKTFRCSHCSMTVFFENARCERCGWALGFMPDTMTMVAFEAAPDGWQPCFNYVEHGACNWMVGLDEGTPLCKCCRYTEVIPALGKPENKSYWCRAEAAKRRLFYSLFALGLPLPSRADDPQRGLAFRFLADPGPGQKTLTGHEDGVITLSIHEADDAEREARRTALHEPYRTLLGHLRHEIGHFYWDQLIAHSDRLEPFRAVFGDERQDYAQALQAHYAAAPTPDWQQTYISMYAGSHPWEDWAETWAHYMHVVDALDTARHWRVALAADDPEAVDSSAPAAVPEIDTGSGPLRSILVEQWLPLSQFLNSMARSLGQRDFYPFVVAPAVIEKLCFVHEAIQASRSQAGQPEATLAAQDASLNRE